MCASLCSGSSNHVLHLTQRGNEVAGTHQWDFVARDLAGTIRRKRVRLRSSYGGQTGDSLSFAFTGRCPLTDGRSARLGEYLGAKWTATRG